jgi:hypothetical protein
MKKIEEKDKKNIEFYLKLLPVCIVLLIILGYSYLSGYYGLYNLDIIHYLDTTEILTSFLPLVKLIFIPLLIAYLVLRYLHKSFNEPDSASKKEIKTDTQKKWLKIFKNVGMFLLILIIGLSIMLIFFFFVGTYVATNYGVIFFWIMATAVSYMTMVFNKMSPIMNTITHLILGWLIYFGAHAYFMDKHRAIKEGDRISEATFVYQNDTISTTENIRYIGQTNNYIFLHEFKTNTNFIYEFDKISNMQIRTDPVKIDWNYSFYHMFDGSKKKKDK